MGASFSVRVQTPGALAAASAAAVVRAVTAAGAGARPRIKRIKAQVIGSPVATVLQLYRAAAANLGAPTGATSVLGQGAQSEDVSVTNVDTQWTSSPTIAGGSVPIDGLVLAGTVGYGEVLVLPEPIILEPNTGLIIWAPSAGAQIALTPYWEE
jgi:hypothetical protein